jgi:hypothetical protein
MRYQLAFFVEIPRPPANSGTFIPPSQFEGEDGGKPKPHKGWRPTVFVRREALVNILDQHLTGRVDPILLWATFGAREIGPVLSKWLDDIRANAEALGLVEKEDT